MTSHSAPRAAIILAAGQGTRMKSPLPKVLHPVGRRAMLDHAIDAAQALGCDPIIVVVGEHSPQVRAHVVARLGEAAIAVQDPPQGTGHAVRCAQAALAGFEGQVVVTYGDVPLLKAADIEPVFASSNGVTVIGFEARDPGAYGRLVMEGETLAAITEAKEASPAVLALTACNSGVMAAPAALLFDLLAEVRNDNAKGEYYLTDVVALARQRGAPTRAVFAAEDSVMGVNAQAELAQAEALFQSVQRDAFLAAGVTMSAPDTVHFAWDTQVGPGTVIEPYVVFGPGAVIAANARIRSFSHIEGATVASGAEVGPYARLRPGAALGEDVKVGNFVEVKNVAMAKGSKANTWPIWATAPWARVPTSAQAPSSATTTACSNTARRSKTGPSSAPTAPWLPRSPSAPGPWSGRDQSSPATSPPATWPWPAPPRPPSPAGPPAS